MAKYSTFHYSDGTHYGTSSAVPQIAPVGELVWSVQVDWENTGWSGTNEATAGHLIDLQIKRGRENYLNDNGSGLVPMQIGTCTLTFDDVDRRYDPYNASSPLYPHVLPGRRAKVTVYVVATKTTYELFTGNIIDIQPATDSKHVVFEIEDGFRWLADAAYKTDAIYTTTISSAITRVLQIVQWPFGRLMLNNTIQPLQIFEPGEGDGRTIINALAEANLGNVWMGHGGGLYFAPLHWNGAGTYTVDQSELLKEIYLPQPWETVRNKISVVANRRGKRPARRLWALNGVEEFNSGQEKSYEATYVKAVSVAVGDIIANTQPDGSGYDVSTSFSAHLSDITPQSCEVTVVNGGSGTAYLLYLTVNGREIVSSPITKRSEDATSIALYGPRKFKLDNPWMQDKGFATAYATYLKNFLKDPQKNPTVMIQQRPTIQFPPDLLSKITVTAASRGINEQFHLGGIEHKWLEQTGQSVLTTWYLQKVMYNATIPTPDPFYPGLPDIPDDPGYDPPDWSPHPEPWPDPHPPDTSTCLALGALTNGPFTMTPDVNLLDSDGTKVTKIAFPCTIRDSGATNPTYVKITGPMTDRSGQLITSQYAWTLKALDLTGAPILTGNNTIDPSILSGWDGPRYSEFLPLVSGGTKCSGFTLELTDPGTAGSYTYNWDFSDGAQGWFPTCGWLPNWTGALDEPFHWQASSGALNIYALGGTGTDYRQWHVRLEDVWAQAGTTLRIDRTNSSSPGWEAIGAWIDTTGSKLLADALWVYSNTDLGGYFTKDLSAYAGKQILAVGFYVQSNAVGGWWSVQNATLTNADYMGTARSWRLDKIEIYNVCGENS